MFKKERFWIFKKKNQINDPEFRVALEFQEVQSIIQTVLNISGEKNAKFSSVLHGDHQKEAFPFICGEIKSGICVAM